MELPLHKYVMDSESNIKNISAKKSLTLNLSVELQVTRSIQ